MKFVCGSAIQGCSASFEAETEQELLKRSRVPSLSSMKGQGLSRARVWKGELRIGVREAGSR